MVGLESKLGVATEFSNILQSVIILLVITRAKVWAPIAKFLNHREAYGQRG
jgi:F0F1-type ATP synthase membrane subunit b/b'